MTTTLDVVEIIGDGGFSGVSAAQLTLAIDGRHYGGWLDVEICRSLDRFSHTFSLGYTDQWVDNNEPWPIRDGAACQVFFGKELLITGYVNSAQWSVTAEAWELNAHGRSLSGDLEDCSVLSDVSSWKFAPPITIVNKLIEPYGIKAISTVSQALLPIEFFQLNEGETVHDAIDRLCKALALLPVSRPDGNIELVRGAGTWQKSRDPKALLPGAEQVKSTFNRRNPLGAGTLAASISVGTGASLVVPTAEAIQRRLDTDDQNRYSDYAAIGQSRGSRFRAGKIISRMSPSRTKPSRATARSSSSRTTAFPASTTSRPALRGRRTSVPGARCVTRSCCRER